MNDARRVFTSLYGSDMGFEAQFSPGTDLETMGATEFMQRLQVAEPFNVTEHLQASSVYNRRLIDTFNRMEERYRAFARSVFSRSVIFIKSSVPGNYASPAFSSL